MIAFRTCKHGHTLIDNTQLYDNHGWPGERCRTCHRITVERAREKKTGTTSRFLRNQRAARYRHAPEPTDPRVIAYRQELAKRTVRHG